MAVYCSWLFSAQNYEALECFLVFSAEQMDVQTIRSSMEDELAPFVVYVFINLLDLISSILHSAN